MANTGNKQATIAYKVRSTDGAPLDINGMPTSETGQRQAIALLVGTTNPNPALYEVQFYFNTSAEIEGDPSVIYKPSDCSTGVIFTSVGSILFEPAAPTVQQFTLTSSDAWNILSIDAAITGVFSLDVVSGSAGVFLISVTPVNAAVVGQGYITFKNLVSGATATIFLINVLSKPWILASGRWNMLGFWYAASLWKNN